MKQQLCMLAGLFFACAPWMTAQDQPVLSKANDSELQYVVYLSRHGVRSPTSKAAQYNQYSAGAWPEWPVNPVT